MVGVAFHFEPNDVDVWSGRRIDLDAWNYAIKAAGDVDRAVVVNTTSQALSSFDADMDISIVPELPVLENAVHVCCPWEADRCRSATALWDFDHAGLDWYVFGPAQGWRRDLDRGLYVPQAGVGALHAVHIASVVLLHRFHILNRA